MHCIPHHVGYRPHTCNSKGYLHPILLLLYTRFACLNTVCTFRWFSPENTRSAPFNQCCGSESSRIRSFLVTRIRIRENTRSGSGSFIHKKTPCYSNFLVIKLSKTQFCLNNFLIFDFKWHNNFLSLILSVI